MENEGRILDPETQRYGDKESFEQVVLRQMQRCVDNLSKEVTVGHFKQKQTKQGVVQVWQEDVRHMIINSVQTLMDLMLHYIKGDYEEHIESVLSEIVAYKKELDSRFITIRGKGKVRVGSLPMIPKDTMIYNDFLEFKVEKYREIFSALTLVYNKHKSQMQEDTYDAPDVD